MMKGRRLGRCMVAIFGLLWLGVATAASAQTATFGTATLIDNGFDTTGIAVADVDQDGHLDVIVAACDGGYVRVFHGVGDGTFDLIEDFAGGLVNEEDPDFPIDPSLWGLAVADFNGDTYPDIATGNVVNGAVAILLND